MQTAFKEKFSYTMTVRSRLGGESVMVRRITAFPVASEMGRGGMSVSVAAAYASSSAALLPGVPL